MKHYSEFKKELNGIKDVSETLKSIEKISASKVKTIKNKILNLEKYTLEIFNLLNRLSLFYKNNKNFLLTKRKSGKKILLVIMGEKGLVGPLWQKITSKTLLEKNNYDSILVVGKKGYQKLLEVNINPELFFSFSEKNDLDENINILNKKIIEYFKKNHIKKIDIIYAKSISISEQEIKKEKLLPFTFEKENNDKNQKIVIGFPIFDTSKKILFEKLIKKYIKTFFYKIILNSKLSENSNKTIEMEHAKEKSNIEINKLIKNYKKDKRKKVNQSQLEMISTKKHKKN